MKNLKVMSAVISLALVSQMTLNPIQKPMLVIPEKTHEEHFKTLKKENKNPRLPLHK